MKQHTPNSKTRGLRSGSVLIAVMIVIVVLSLVAYRFTDSMSGVRRAAQRSADAGQARAAAASGVQWAVAALADPDTFNNVLGRDPTQNNDIFNDQTYWTDPNNPKRQARFSIISLVPSTQSGFEKRYALVNEGGKLNINAMIAQDPTGAALYNALMQIPNMTPDVAANIVDWVDEDDEPGQASNGEAAGAESATYAALGYQAKNGPLNTLDELLLVSGVTPQLLYGTDQNQNGVSEESEGGNLDRGWSAFLTVYGREVSVDSTGQLKIYINGDQNADDLRNIYAAMIDAGVDREMAAYIMGVKILGTRNLVNMNSPQNSSQGGSGQGGSGQGGSGQGGSGQGGSGSGGSGKGGSSSGGSGQGGTVRSTSTQGGVTVTVTLSGSNQGGSNQGGSSQGGSNQGGSNQNGTSNKPPTVLDKDAFIQLVESRLDSATANGQAVTSIASLAGTYLTVSAANGNNPATIYYSPLNSTDQMSQLLEPLLDKIATKEEVELIPRLNVNVAPREVIAGLPGLEAADVDAIMAARDGKSPADLGTTGAWLISAAGLMPQKFQALEQYVTGTSMIYRAQVIGYISGGGPVSRVEAVIDTNLGYPRIVYYRDLGDLDNPRGFQHPDKQTQ